MKLKKLLSLLLMLSLISTAAVIFTACGESESESESPTESESQSESESRSEGSSETEDDGKVTYTVTVTDKDGNGVQNVGVQICQGTVCFKAIATNADGVAEITFKPNGKELKILLHQSNLPEGYTPPPAIDEDGYCYKFAEGETSATLVLGTAE